MTAVILQARLDSSRLPQKSLLDLNGEPLVFRVMSALKKLSCDIHVLACPEDSLDAFAPLAEKASFHIIAGSKEDVLQRYCKAIRHFKIDTIIRATGDNPFVFTDSAEKIKSEALELKADYASYAGLPHGAGVEFVTAKALLEAERAASLQSEREHVCPYLYNNPDKFLLHRPLAPEIWQEPSLRITVDTKDDYEKAKVLYTSLTELESTEKRDRHLGENIICACKRKENL